MGPAKIGNELAHGDAIRVSVVNDRIVQRSGRNPAVVLGHRGSQAACGLWIIRGARLRHSGFGGNCQMAGRLNLWMILDCYSCAAHDTAVSANIAKFRNKFRAGISAPPRAGLPDLPPDASDKSAGMPP